MTESKPTSSRHDQILQALAHMLETNPGKTITTAKLAKEVGVSEAALYRHFPSKARMFEGLIQFIEETLFSRVNRILQEEEAALPRCEAILTLLLAFAERNPGMCRILMGDALAGELERLRERVIQVFDRLETQIKQVIREAEIREGLRPAMPINQAAILLLTIAEGRINQFVRSEFKKKPTQDWNLHWQVLSKTLFERPAN
ncbi:nucleoid occlusion factor SlmA [Reinekea marina]|uniref:Nucleoid occlusion factor SlmA n=1 Tax=Reinekea marina TaxID=1310421 RepID=A0ABV7WTP8_9GAMM|nr:nucleoid occlusion factor SlmA [Reinekea marina]MBU2865345.1 nucleoid occlusion factor SlmA [Reinekea forsetii]MDN3647952.1 nucleoid occlusion factor SlmA [Reinekea marina]